VPTIDKALPEPQTSAAAAIVLDPKGVEMRGIVLVAAAALVGAGGAAAAVTVLHSAQGSGHVQFGTTQEFISFTAVQHADGSVTGSAEIHDITAGVKAHVDVNCLNVVGNTATISGIVTSSSDPTIEGFQAIWQVVDNGQGGNAPPDLMSIANLYAVGTGVDCTVPAEYDLAPVTGGNIQVD
jgi:hypothetical protein